LGMPDAPDVNPQALPSVQFEGGWQMTDDQKEPARSSGGHRAPGFLTTVRAGGWTMNRVRLVVLVASLGTATAGILVALFFSSSGQTRTVAGPGPHGAVASAQPGQPTTSAPGVTSAQSPGRRSGGGGRPASSKLPPRIRKRILRWEAGRGGKELAAVERQIGTAMQSGGLGLYADMRTACVSLSSEVGAAAAGPPLPIAPRQRQYARTLDGISRAAGDCRGAISVKVGDESVEMHVDRPLLSQSRREFAAMSADLYRVTGDILLVQR
jgi:hypothetical protein